MALVPTPDRLALTHPQTGITVGVYPSSDPAYDIQLYRAASTKSGAGPTSVPASSKFSELATLGVINGAARVSYVDSLPLSNTLWWYKARSIRTNVATPSAFTTAVVAQAATLPTTAPGAIPFSGKPIQVSVNLTTNALLRIGTSTNPGALSKTVRFPAVSFQPVSSTTDWFYGAGLTGGYSLQASTKRDTFVQTYLMPTGVTVTKWSMVYTRLSAAVGSTFHVVLRRVSSSGGDSVVKTFSASSAFPGTIQTSTVSFTYSSGGGYLYVVLTFNRAGGLLRSEEVNYCQLGYQMSRYDHGY